MKMVSLSRPLTGIGTGAFLALSLVALIAASGCKEDPPPPLPEAKTAPTPTTLELEVPEEDGGAEEEVAKPKGKGVRKPSGPLAACCAALRQNAASAPPETQGHMLNAAAACDAANKAGGTSFPGFPGLAALPAACK